METTSFVKVFERVPGRGEDAAACIEWSAGPAGDPGGACACAGVFDGLGGLGARPVETPSGVRSEAYVASRCARDALCAEVARAGGLLQRAFAACASDGEVCAAADGVRRRLEAAFDAAFVRRQALSGGVLLPTNAACAFRLRARGRDHVVALWAGDARCYLLDPDRGLHQLTSDDNGTGADALADLRGAAPAAQTRRLGYDVARGAGTRLSLAVVELGMPAVALCCTDGAYSAGIRTPMHFELLLWRWILSDEAPAGFGPRSFALMDDFWGARAQDDCSVAGFSAGLSAGAFDDGWRRRARVRMQGLYQCYVMRFPVSPMRGGPGPATREEQERMFDELWKEYRPEYERYLTKDRRGDDDRREGGQREGSQQGDGRQERGEA